MPTQCCHSETIVCGLRCLAHLGKPVQAFGTFMELAQLPTWLLTVKELPRGEKRSWDESSSSATTGKRRCGRLTFLPRIYRPLIVLDDDVGSDYPTNSPPPFHETKSSPKHVSIEDENAATSTKPSLAPVCTKYILLPHGMSESSSQAGNQTCENYLGATSFAGVHTQTVGSADQNEGRFHEKGRPQNLPSLPYQGLDASGNFFSGENGSCEPQKPQIAVATPKIPRNAISVEDRKRYFIETPPAHMVREMKKRVADIYGILDPQRSDGECWLHPKPPLPYGSIRYNFHWKDQNSCQALSVNFGVIALLVESSLTEHQQKGYINNAWHLSHLCGNWTCCNWRHFTVEKGSINIQRNACFIHRNGCIHNPPCMKHLKRRLSFATSPTSKVPLPGETLGAVPGEKAQNGDEAKPLLLSYPSRILPMPYAQPLILLYPTRILPMPYAQRDLDIVF
ncbi:hypothetical protein MMC18_003853 [Xylographa bjoerkii]|nr:hypothetical protein [Xylographa bjoerkii]